MSRGYQWARNCSHGPGVEGPKSNLKRQPRRKGGVPVREKTFTYFAMSITLKCSKSAGASLQRRFYMPAGSPVVSFTTTARKGTSSSPQMGTGASRKSSLASIVRRMGALCTSRRCGPKKRASAYGNARNVTRSALMGRFQVRQPLPANAVPTFSAKSCDRILSAKIVGTALVRLSPRLHPDGQFQPDSKSAFRQKLAVDNLPQCAHALLRRDNHHLLPRPPLPFHQDARTVRTHVFGQRPLFRHAFVLRTNLYGHRPRNPLFESASRHRHNLPRLP